MQQQILHLLCTAGTCRLHFSGHEHVLRPGCCMIAMASHVGHIEPSDDCRLSRLLLPAEQQVACMPHSSYGTCGWLHLFMHPIFRLEGEALAMLRRDFEDVAFRLEHTPEAYRQEAVLQSMRLLYLDVMNAHAALFEHEEVTQRAADIMSRFIRMLEDGSYRQHRTVAYYAEQLCVTSKHLHRVSAQVSGRAPSYWIQQFTVMEIHHLLRHGKLTAKEVATRMNFDSMSHFSRYIKGEISATHSEV
ncbi:MAG: AraC family transcriptional regulator [Bacteroidaceae bacterium]|nr:AraC family transcriptional regulator [Bacteroidaceae bacterium]